MIRRFRTRIFATVRVVSDIFKSVVLTSYSPGGMEVFLRFILRLVLPFNRLILRYLIPPGLYVVSNTVERL